MSELLDFTIKTAKKAGKLILKEAEKPLKISKKGKNDLVTQVDKASEELIIKEILKKYPEHKILAEESTNEIEDLSGAEYLWIIDPIDGTTNFSHGLPQYSVSIAVMKISTKKTSKNFEYLGGEIIAGVVYAPKLSELFHAEKGKGAYLNNKRINVSEIKKIEDSLLVTGFPPTHKEENLKYFSKMLDKCQAVRRLGSAALDLAYIACGRFDGYWEFGLKPWDIAAGSLLVKEAGGKVTDTNGNLLDLFGKDILATNKKVHLELVKCF